MVSDVDLAWRELEKDPRPSNGSRGRVPWCVLNICDRESTPHANIVYTKLPKLFWEEPGPWTMLSFHPTFHWSPMEAHGGALYYIWGSAAVPSPYNLIRAAELGAHD